MYKKITLNYRGAGIDGVEHVCQNQEEGDQKSWSGRK